MEVFRARRAEIELRLKQQDHLLYYSLLVFLGILAFLGSRNVSVAEWVCPIAFGSSLFFFLMAILFLQHELPIVYNRQYIAMCINHQVQLPKDMVTWEFYLKKKRKTAVLKKEWPIIALGLAFLLLGCFSLPTTSIGGQEFVLIPYLIFAILICILISFVTLVVLYWKLSREEKLLESLASRKLGKGKPN